MTYTEIYDYLHHPNSQGTIAGLDPLDRRTWLTLNLLSQRNGFAEWFHEINSYIQDEIFVELRDLLQSFADSPVDLLIFCPNCCTQHIDQPQPEKHWDNPPHRSHECQYCGHVWRPSDTYTNGVASIQSKGQRDGFAIPTYYSNDREE
jgi:hypothetical protein